MSAPTVAFLKNPMLLSHLYTALHDSPLILISLFHSDLSSRVQVPASHGFQMTNNLFPGLHQPNRTPFSFLHLFICNCNHIIELHTPWSVTEVDLWPDTKKLEFTTSKITHAHFWLVLLNTQLCFSSPTEENNVFSVQGRPKWNIFLRLVVPLLHPDCNLAL